MIVLSVALLLIGGLSFGFLSGIMHMNRLALEVKAKNSFSKQQALIREIIALLARFHRVYVTLLLLYLLSLETLPVAIGSFAPRTVTAAITLFFVLVCAHCVPMAWFSGQRQISRMGRLAGVIRGAMWLFTPVVAPLARVLDRLAKREESTLTIAELKKSLFWHSEAMQSIGIGDLLSRQQVTMVNSLLDSLQTPVLLHMLPMDKVFTLTTDSLVCDELLDEVYRRGFSRIPIIESAPLGRVLGILHVSSFLAIDQQRMVTISQMGIQVSRPLFIPKDTGAATVLLKLLAYGEQTAVIVEQSEAEKPSEEILGKSQALGIITQADLMTLVLKTRKSAEVPTPLSSIDHYTSESLCPNHARKKGSYTAFDYEDSHRQELRGSLGGERRC